MSAVLVVLALVTGSAGPVGIYGGAAAGLCEWPTAVAVYDGGPLCSGVLIHPLIVATVAHCGDQFTEVQFGEHATKPGRTVATAGCYANPAADGTPAHDFAYCRLATPVLDLPIAPPLMGCEAEALVVDAPVTLAGFGEVEGGGLGDKYVVEAPVTELGFMDSLVLIGGDGLGTCAGDSGGPGFLRLADGTWRTVGVTFGTTLTCGAGTVMIPLANDIAWLEEHSGLDVTPCHDADGTWNPGPRCDHLAVDPGLGGGSWAEWCAGAAESGPGALCGAPWSGAGDRTAPTVTITAPADGASFADPSKMISVEITADDGDGAGVESVDLEIDGQALGAGLAFPPFMVALKFPAGSFALVATARDFAGNVGASAPVMIAVGDVPATTSGGETTGDSSGEGSSTSDDSATSSGGSTDTDASADASASASATTTAGGDEDGGGCACAASGGDRGAIRGAIRGLFVFVLAVAGARRRRGAAA